jgi:hypothetical protein
MRGKHARTLVIAAALLAVFALASPNRHAGIAIHAHRVGDLSPQQFQAAVDLGAVGFSFLVTWSKRLGH